MVLFLKGDIIYHVSMCDKCRLQTCRRADLHTCRLPTCRLQTCRPANLQTCRMQTQLPGLSQFVWKIISCNLRHFHIALPLSAWPGALLRILHTFAGVLQQQNSYVRQLCIISLHNLDSIIRGSFLQKYNFCDFFFLHYQISGSGELPMTKSCWI